MKREAQKPPYIYRFKPLMWHQCKFCQQEFKRENGWKIIGYPVINGVYSETYCCESCGKTLNDVKAKLAQCYTKPPRSAFCQREQI